MVALAGHGPPNPPGIVHKCMIKDKYLWHPLGHGGQVAKDIYLIYILPCTTCVVVLLMFWWHIFEDDQYGPKMSSTNHQCIQVSRWVRLYNTYYILYYIYNVYKTGMFAILFFILLHALAAASGPKLAPSKTM